MGIIVISKVGRLVFMYPVGGVYVIVTPLVSIFLYVKVGKNLWHVKDKERTT